MPDRYPPLTPAEVVKVLLCRGFFLDRKKGSHHQYVGTWNGSKHTVTVDMSWPTYNDPDLIKSMILQSGMTREQFYGATTKTAKKINLKK